MKKQTLKNQLNKNSDFCPTETVSKLSDFSVHSEGQLHWWTSLLLLLFCFSPGSYCHSTLSHGTDRQSWLCLGYQSLILH